MLGGGEPTFYKDGSASSQGNRFNPANPGKKQIFDGNARESDDNADYRTAIQNEGLKTIVDAESKETAKSWAKLTIQKNTAPRGAGVGSNGGLTFGTPDSTEVKVTKAWKDVEGKDLDENSKVPVKVQLVGKVGDDRSYIGQPVELNADNKWTHTFESLPKTRTVDGKQIEVKYTVEELTVDGFTSKVTGDAEKGFVITNTENPSATTEVPVEKVWKAADGSDLGSSETQPVNVQLVKTVGDATSKVGDPVELNAGNGWKYTFTDLPVTEKVEGEKVDIHYSVEELNVEGFTSGVTGNAKDGFTITNTQTPPPVTEVNVTKVWKAADGSELDPSATVPVKVQLTKTLAGKTAPVGDPVVLNAANGWKHTFTQLPVAENVDGQLVDIHYSVEELSVEGFTSRVTGDAEQGFTITNTQTPPPPTPEPSPTPEPTPTLTPTPEPTPGKPRPRPSMPRTGVDGGSAVVWAVAPGCLASVRCSPVVDAGNSTAGQLAH